jgi:hypothetical protein
MVPSAQLQHIWFQEIPCMAFQSDVDNHLLYFLLSLSALHLHTLCPSDQIVELASRYYLDLGLQNFNAMLPKMNEQNSPSLFISSVLIAIHVLLSRHQTPPEEIYSAPSSWFHAMQGIRKVASAARPWILKSKLEPLLLDNRLPFDGLPMEDSTSGPFTALLRDLTSSDVDAESMAAYQYTVQYLHQVYTLTLDGEEKHIVRKMVLAFPTTVPPKFVSLLESNNPRALVITAHYYGTMALVDELLWLRGAAIREIMGLWTILPVNWRWAMEWPLRQIKRDDLLLAV